MCDTISHTGSIFNNIGTYNKIYIWEITQPLELYSNGISAYEPTILLHIDRKDVEKVEQKEKRVHTTQYKCITSIMLGQQTP